MVIIYSCSILEHLPLRALLTSGQVHAYQDGGYTYKLLDPEILAEEDCARAPCFL